MKNIIKKRMAILLAFALVLPTIIGMLPVSTLQTEAAGYSAIWVSAGSSSKTPLIVEMGSKFNVGHLASVWKNSKDYGTAYMNKSSYTSSNKKVLTVDKKGNVTLKKKGTAKITIKCKGKKTAVHLKVVDKKYTTSKEVAPAKTAVKKLINAMPKTINASNGYALAVAINNYNDARKGVTIVEKRTEGNYTYTYTKYLSSYGTIGESYKGSYTSRLVVPEALEYKTIQQKASTYASKNRVTSTKAAKKVKLASVKQQGKNRKSINVTFNRAVSDANILASIFDDIIWGESAKINKKQATANVSVYDATSKEYYTGELGITKGSKKGTIKLKKWTGNKYASKKFIKGHKYVIGYAGNWGDGKTIKIK